MLKLSEGTTEKASHIFEDAKKGDVDVFVVSFLWLVTKIFLSKLYRQANAAQNHPLLEFFSPCVSPFPLI